MSCVSSMDEGSRIRSSSGAEGVLLHVTNVIYMIWPICKNLIERIRMLQHNIGRSENQYIQAILNGHHQNCLD